MLDETCQHQWSWNTKENKFFCLFLKLDCQDHSDEELCEYTPTPRYTGCWSYEQGNPGEVIYRVASCDSCLCGANEERCLNDDALDRTCDLCITKSELIGNGKQDCMFAIGITTNK